MFDLSNQKELESSFNEFISRPENRPAVEKVQRQEFRDKLRLQELERQLDLDQKVSTLPEAVRASLAPALGHKVLRRLVMTFGNGAEGSFHEWATNPRVLELLTSSAQALKEGRVTEGELEHTLLAYLKAPVNPDREAFLEAARTKVKPPPHLLATALNEHLEERRTASAAARRGDSETALRHYERALAIVDLLEGSNEDDQQEIDSNKCSTLLDMATTRMSSHEYGKAIAACTRVLELKPNHVPALLRRARAFVARREFKEAEKDLEVVEVSSPHNPEAKEIVASIKRLKRVDQNEDKLVYKRMFQ